MTADKVTRLSEGRIGCVVDQYGAGAERRHDPWKIGEVSQKRQAADSGKNADTGHQGGFGRNAVNNGDFHCDTFFLRVEPFDKFIIAYYRVISVLFPTKLQNVPICLVIFCNLRYTKGSINRGNVMRNNESAYKKERERAVIAGLSAGVMPKEQRSDDDSLDELENLLATAGGVCCGRIFQQRQKPNPRSLLGAGKVEELRMMIAMEDCSLVVFDNELTPSQIRALSIDLGVRVIDRSALILDIFAQRAQTREGRLQVELAQYKYLLPRLTGMWTHLDRETASGGKSPIGTRGTGETQLESDRRYISHRIEKLEKELQQVRKSRATRRSRRQKNGVPLIALVGYTNAGKSTLMNYLTHADIPANDRLFDTLDTTTRRLRLQSGKTLLFSDTVGFIRRLPHHLVEAFQSTLEELSYADVILHVIDPTGAQWQEKAAVAEKLIDRLARLETPRLRVFNKADLLHEEERELLALENPEYIFISARDGIGADALLFRLDVLTGSVVPEPWMQFTGDFGDREG